MSTSTWPQDPDWFAARLRKEIDRYVALGDGQVSALYRHFVLLGRWNAKLNLTSVRSPEEAIVRHYCESLFFAAHIPEAAPGSRFCDVGSGAGFPGIPVAVAQPAWHVALIESHQRKGVFLREATRPLPNVEVLSTRAETVTQNFDWLISRAVDPADVLRLLPRLASRVGLLLGSDDAAKISGDARFQIVASTPLPWGDRRVCLYGHCFT